RELHLLRGREQLDLADYGEEGLERVGRGRVRLREPALPGPGCRRAGGELEQDTSFLRHALSLPGSWMAGRLAKGIGCRRLTDKEERAATARAPQSRPRRLARVRVAGSRVG